MATNERFATSKRWLAAAGLLVGARAALELGDPVYYNPVTLVDYAAAYGTTVAWTTVGVALVVWWRANPIRRGSAFLLVAALGIVASAVGNLLEDVIRVDIGEVLYSYGGMVGAISLILASLAAISAKSPFRWSGLFLLGVVAGTTFPDSGGEFVSGAALVAMALWLGQVASSQTDDAP